MEKKSIRQAITREYEDLICLLHNVPSQVVALFCVSVVLMNILANKSIDTGIEWLALDGGLAVSWLSFLCMDIIAKRFGPKASFKISLFAVLCNLIACGILIFVSYLPGVWSAYFTHEVNEVNLALNETFRGTWYVLFGSMLAFIVSAGVNSLVHKILGDKLNDNTFKTFAIRSYVSTMFGQFVDNLVFALVVSHVFFGWTLIQCITCSITGALAELLCEVVFSPWGYKVAKSWELNDVGHVYVKRIKNEK